MLEIIKQWFLDIGRQYGVNPLIFGSIYVGAIPFFSWSVAWGVRRYRAGKSVALPVMVAGACFVSAYVYLLIVGQNVPWWVYGILGFMIVYGVAAAFRKVRKQIKGPTQ